MLGIFITARNSSGAQKLLIEEYNGEYCLTLVGEYNEKPIQIDFDSLSPEELKELADWMYFKLGKSNPQTTQSEG